MGTGADATITNLVVANLSASAKANARNDLVSDGARGAWDFLSRTWRANPLRRELDFVAKVTFPYDVAKLPTVKGNAEAVVVRASDETASDWRVVPGAVFDAAAEKVTVLVDVFSLFSVAARASARAVEPARVRHTGGAPLTLDGVDFRVPPVYNATGSVFCKFGELFTKAEWVSSRDPRGFGDAALCATPAVSNAGFVSVEFYDAGTYQNSASDLRVLFTAPPLVSRVSPSSGPDTGAALVALAGAAFAHLGGDGKRDVACHFGDFGDFGGVAPGVAVSSAVALCETPAADAKRHAEVRVGVASDGAHDARTAAYRYRVSLADAVFTLGGDGAEGRPKRIRTRESCSASAPAAPSSTRGSGRSAALWRARRSARSELWWSQRGASPKTARGSTAWRPRAPGGRRWRSSRLRLSRARVWRRFSTSRRRIRFFGRDSLPVGVPRHGPVFRSRTTPSASRRRCSSARTGDTARAWRWRRAATRRRSSLARKKQNRGARSGASPPRLSSRARSSQR